MNPAGTPFIQSWGLYFQVLFACWILGPALAYGGYHMVQTSEIVLVIIGGVCLLAGPVLPVAALFFPRPASGPCPSCGHRMYRMLPGESEAPLLCPHCAAYSLSSQDRLVPMPETALSNEATFAVALPWDDIAGEKVGTIAFSAQDYLTDKLNDLIARKEPVRVIDTWPQGCCVCGEVAKRYEDYAVKVSLMGRALEAETVIAARGIPYCEQHNNGVAFGRVDFAVHLLSNPTAFGLKFRSYAFREAFRKLHHWTFETQPRETS